MPNLELLRQFNPATPLSDDPGTLAPSVASHLCPRLRRQHAVKSSIPLNCWRAPARTCCMFLIQFQRLNLRPGVEAVPHVHAPTPILGCLPAEGLQSSE